MKLRVLGVSSGIGLSLFTFKKYLIGNIEPRPIFHTPGSEQWKANFGDIPLKRKLDELKDLKPNVIVSSPDCGSGSILRLSRAKEYGNHKENHSLLLFFHSIKHYKPEFFLFENLDGLFKSFSKGDFEEQVADYRLIIHNASVAAWGNSQLTRTRLVIIGIRKDLNNSIDKFFKLPNYKHKIKTCQILYGDLIEPNSALGHIREADEEMTTIYAGKKMSNAAITQHWLTELKDKRRWEVKDRKFKSAPGVYRNRNEDYPSTARKAARQYDHLGKMLTPRQLARIQGAPDSFILYIQEDKLNYWINKTRTAVTKSPPYEISLWFKKRIKKTYHLWK